MVDTPQCPQPLNEAMLVVDSTFNHLIEEPGSNLEATLDSTTLKNLWFKIQTNARLKKAFSPENISCCFVPLLPDYQYVRLWQQPRVPERRQKMFISVILVIHSSSSRKKATMR